MNPTITMKVYEPSGGTHKTTLTRSYSKQWLDQFCETGAGSFEIDLDDADVANIQMDDIVQCYLTGVTPACFGFIIEDVQRSKVDPSEEAGQRRTYGGRGRAAILDRAIVYPERGVGRRGGDSRMFDYTSSSYSETFGGWNDASILQHGRADPGPWSSIDTDFYPYGLTPDAASAIGGAKWIWYRNYTGSTPIADAYFYAEHTIPQTGEYAAYITADNAYELFIDGASVGAETFNEDDDPALWQNVKRYDVQLDVGVHRFAIHAYNGGGPAGVIMSLHKTYLSESIVDGEVTSVPRNAPEFVTDDTWRSIGGPNMSPPGMTPGAILQALNSEAQLRGTLTGSDLVSLAFLGNVDSASRSWPTLNIGVQVGTKYTDVLRQLAEAGVVWKMKPDQNQLYAYTIFGDQTTVSYTPNINIESMADHTSTQDLANVILGRVQVGGVDQLGWMETTNPTSVSKRRRRETFLSAQNQEPTFVRTLATNLFAERAIPAVEVSVAAIEPDTTDSRKRARPYLDYEVGDWLRAPSVTIGPVASHALFPTPDAPALYRVRAISIAEDDDGNTTVNPELGTLITERALRLQQWVNTMIPGALGGTTSNASLH